MNRALSVIFVLFVLLVLLVPFVSASNGDSGTGGGDSGTGGGLPNPLSSGNVFELLNKILNGIIIYIAPPIFALMILIGAFQILFAGGNPEKFALGRRIILYAVIGYGILLIATGISAIIKNLLGVQ